MSTPVFNVLFLCTANSARSIMAESIIQREGRGRFRGFSAGSHPRGDVHPYAIELLRNLRHPVEGLHSKGTDSFLQGPEMDFVFTLCDLAAQEPCPVWPGHPMTAHWGMPDPAQVTGIESVRRHAFSDTYRMLLQRIGIFVNLPLATLDQMSLKRQVENIGTLPFTPTPHPARTDAGA
ncbi:MAG: arsenate reductase ArsC [Magnetococcus sp. WYHC-3]